MAFTCMHANCCSSQSEAREFAGSRGTAWLPSSHKTWKRGCIAQSGPDKRLCVFIGKCAGSQDPMRRCMMTILTRFIVCGVQSLVQTKVCTITDAGLATRLQLWWRKSSGVKAAAQLNYTQRASEAPPRSQSLMTDVKCDLKRGGKAETDSGGMEYAGTRGVLVVSIVT